MVVADETSDAVIKQPTPQAIDRYGRQKLQNDISSEMVPTAKAILHT